MPIHTCFLEHFERLPLSLQTHILSLVDTELGTCLWQIQHYCSHVSVIEQLHKEVHRAHDGVSSIPALNSLANTHALCENPPSIIADPRHFRRFYFQLVVQHRYLSKALQLRGSETDITPDSLTLTGEHSQSFWLTYQPQHRIPVFGRHLALPGADLTTATTTFNSYILSLLGQRLDTQPQVFNLSGTPFIQ